MAPVTAATVTGWVILGLIGYILGEYTSVFARFASGLRFAGGGVKRVKGRPARKTAFGLGGLFAGIYAGGFIWAFAASLLGASAVGGGALLWGLQPREVIIVFLAALLAGLALYSGAAADEAMEGADD
jgi:hypothetical protein